MTPDYTTVESAANAAWLTILGGFHEQDGPTTLLFGPREPGFWAHVRDTPEFQDGAADPMDRWSARVIGVLAAKLGAEARFPFGGPPWSPFIDWALRTGRAWRSPVSLLVHDSAGLMVSYRGALIFPDRIALPPTGARPCDTCAEKPCRTACPVDALGEDRYDVAACRDWLDQGGEDCRTGGCLARRSCPISAAYGRDPAQSAFHMAAFHP